MTHSRYVEEMTRVHPTERLEWVSVFVNDKGEEMIGLNDVRTQLHDIDGVCWDSGVNRWRVDGLDGFYCTFDTRHEAIKYCWLQQIVFNRAVMLTSEAFDYMREADLEFVHKKLGIEDDFMLKFHNR